MIMILYHSPLIYQNNLTNPPLDLADVADIHSRTLSELTRLRDLNIKRKAKNAFADLQKGTIVVHVQGDKEVPTQADGTRSLVPTAQDIYKIKSFTSGKIGANVVSLVTGDERTLPVSSVRRLMLEDSLGIDIDPNVLFSDIKTARLHKRYRYNRTGPQFITNKSDNTNIPSDTEKTEDANHIQVNKVEINHLTRPILKHKICQFNNETETFVKKEIDRLRFSEWKAFTEAKSLAKHLSSPLTRPQILSKDEEFDFASLTRYNLPPITDPEIAQKIWDNMDNEDAESQNNTSGSERTRVKFAANVPTLYPEENKSINFVNAFTAAGAVIRYENNITIREFSCLNAYKVR